MVKAIIVGFTCLVTLAIFQTSASGQTTGSIDSRSIYAPVGKPTSMPIGWKLFCTAQPEECVPAGTGAQSVRLDAYAWKQLVTINSLANSNIEGLADTEHYRLKALNIPNWWTYPDDGKGNCNDYVLLKRRLLIEAGWPKAALLMTVVLDHQGAGHLILTVKTNAGDLILDNLNTEIVRWDETGYTFLKRQSPANPNVWLALDSKSAPSGSASLR
jgi:predicted transglutaminase-like cysteine proteinase